ncbi:MAG TPA: hypothetical protein VGJ26_20100 [Pirellulales bacterium]|jgi:hypothetical protein
MPSPAQVVLDREFLEMRARVLELAAALDRLDRAGGPPSGDPRVASLRQAIDALRQSGPDGAEPNRTERVQLIFSRQYDAAWRKSLGVLQR